MRWLLAGGVLVWACGGADGAPDGEPAKLTRVWTDSQSSSADGSSECVNGACSSSTLGTSASGAAPADAGSPPSVPFGDDEGDAEPPPSRPETTSSESSAATAGESNVEPDEPIHASGGAGGLGDGLPEAPHSSGGAFEPGDGAGGAGGEGGDSGRPACVADPVSFSCIGPAAARANYHVAPLGFLVAGRSDHSPVSMALAINADGVVVGNSQSCDRNNGFVFEQGQMVPLPPLTPGGDSNPIDINDAGVIVGRSHDKPVIWRDRVPSALALPYWPSFYARDIDNLDRVLLSTNARDSIVSVAGPCLATGFDSCSTSLIWDDGVLTEIPFDVPNLGVRANAMNDRGEVVGTIVLANYEEVAFLYDGNTTRILPSLSGLPPVTGAIPSTEALGINNNGQIVGSSSNGSVYRAVMWEGGQIRDITPDTGYDVYAAAAWAINESGVVVAHFRDTATTFNGMPYVYDHGSFAVFETDAEDGFARDINARGEIAGRRSAIGTIGYQAAVWSPSCYDACCGADTGVNRAGD